MDGVLLCEPAAYRCLQVPRARSLRLQCLEIITITIKSTICCNRQVVGNATGDNRAWANQENGKKIVSTTNNAVKTNISHKERRSRKVARKKRLLGETHLFR
jgi:hypothetical protein